MRTFKQYTENREEQFSYLQRILMHLKMGKGLDGDTLAQMSTEEIENALQEIGMGGSLWAHRVKSVVGGGTDLDQDLRRNRQELN